MEIRKYICKEGHITQRVFEDGASIPGSVFCMICDFPAESALFIPATTDERYASRINIIRDVARQHGYAIGEHGSKTRDYDLIAAPWVDSASPADVLIEEIRIAIDGVIVQEPESKPHGRRGWNIVIGADLYFDISVMPLSK